MWQMQQNPFPFGRRLLLFHSRRSKSYQQCQMYLCTLRFLWLAFFVLSCWHEVSMVATSMIGPIGYTSTQHETRPRRSPEEQGTIAPIQCLKLCIRCSDASLLVASACGHDQHSDKEGEKIWTCPQANVSCLVPRLPSLRWPMLCASTMTCGGELVWCPLLPTKPTLNAMLQPRTYITPVQQTRTKNTISEAPRPKRPSTGHIIGLAVSKPDQNVSARAGSYIPLVGPKCLEMTLKGMATAGQVSGDKIGGTMSEVDATHMHTTGKKKVYTTTVETLLFLFFGV